jgi:NADPH2:quinone reductase
MHVTEVPIPEPGEGEAAGDVQYAGVGFVETLFRNGTFSLPLPLTPGIGVAGTVRAVGPGVTGLRAGQPVAALLNDFGRGSLAGGYAELAIARADLAWVHRHRAEPGPGQPGPRAHRRRRGRGL